MHAKTFQLRVLVSVRQSHAALKVGTDAMVLGALLNSEGKKQALDIGTGTGVLALMVAQRNEKIQVTAVEKESKANQDARFNFNNSPYAKRLQLLEIDFLSLQSKIKKPFLLCLTTILPIRMLFPFCHKR